MFSKTSKRAAKKPRLTDDPKEETYFEKQGRWRDTAVRLTKSEAFQALLHISITIKELLTHFYAWAEKKRGEAQQARKEWEKSNVPEFKLDDDD